MDSHPSPRSRALISRPTFWIGTVLVLLLVILGAGSGGFTGILIMLGLAALITGLYTVITKRGSWAGLPSSRKAGAVALAAGLVVVVAGSALMPASSQTAPAEAESTSKSSVPPTPTATEASIDTTPCEAESDTRMQGEQGFTCTTDELGNLVWMTTEKSTKLIAVREAAAEKAAADEAAAQKAVDEKVTAAKAAAQKEAAAQKAASEQAGAARAAAQKKAAAQQAAADQAAAESSAAARAAEQTAADQNAGEQSAADQGVAVGYVHPGSYCSGGAGVSKTGKPMICAPASDGRNRWQSAG